MVLLRDVPAIGARVGVKAQESVAGLRRNVRKVARVGERIRELQEGTSSVMRSVGLMLMAASVLVIALRWRGR